MQFFEIVRNISCIKLRNQHARAILNPQQAGYANSFLNHLSSTDGEWGWQFSCYIYKNGCVGVISRVGLFSNEWFSLHSPVGLHAEIEGVKGGGVNIDVHLGTTALDL